LLKITKFLISVPAALAQLVEQLTCDHKFQGQNQAAVGKMKIAKKLKFLICGPARIGMIGRPIELRSQVLGLKSSCCWHLMKISKNNLSFLSLCQLRWYSWENN
jgi:hypothetical protein